MSTDQDFITVTYKRKSRKVVNDNNVMKNEFLSNNITISNIVEGVRTPLSNILQNENTEICNDVRNDLWTSSEIKCNTKEYIECDCDTKYHNKLCRNYQYSLENRQANKAYDKIEKKYWKLMDNENYINLMK